MNANLDTVNNFDAQMVVDLSHVTGMEPPFSILDLRRQRGFYKTSIRTSIDGSANHAPL